MKILINHIGYEQAGKKRAVIEAPEQAGLSDYHLVEQGTGSTVHRGRLNPEGRVERWKDWHFYSADFSAFQQQGTYSLEIPLAEGSLRSEHFEIKNRIFLDRCLPALLSYFRSQRCSGEVDQADQSIPFTGSREDRVDVHGGWYDASGDTSKYLSHLSYANYLDPQQTPLVVWSLLASRDILAPKPGREDLALRMADEAAHGADFLVRMQDPAGYFYITVFDRWTKEVDQRTICVFRDQEGLKSDDYQAGYRQGGGMAIAALARSAAERISGEYSTDRYLETAVRGFDHLEKHNIKYLDDGRENIIDDYCALMAAAELYGATQEKRFQQAARRRAESLGARLVNGGAVPGWFRADDRERPFFHASDAGLPIVALCRFLELDVVEDFREMVLATLYRSLTFELEITVEVNNPFGYARQYVKPFQRPARTAFFIPHDNETGYWWQGENARLDSLAAAARLASRYFPENTSFRDCLERYASDQLNWILGLNPYDACLLHGFGRNNPEYEKEYPNAFGGICNGITSGFYDEKDIDFLPGPCAEQGEHRWRWSEQWLPHAAWFLLAVCS